MCSDGKRCLVCGFEIEWRQPPAAGNHSRNSISETRVRELHVAVMRFLSELGGDWNQGNTDSRRPSSDEAGKKAASYFWILTCGDLTFIVKNLHCFIAYQASTIEVAIVVKSIKARYVFGESVYRAKNDKVLLTQVITVPSNFGPCEKLVDHNVVIGDHFYGA
ncbi:hypothetical protein PsorP6_000655 [Peronosclerospora sorghi]|uniref:Uncharacterized protein n=1 Tax=Peronosclerospora sorghi TaxID=230839 RepID=A0ACC0WQE0_9STRA|nr:hypothetical protein PsorP6_000655 [Peronosclerospora sorghi]